MREDNIMKSKKYQVLKFILQFIIVAAAGLVGGCAFNNFFEALNLVPTGLSGFALLVKQWLGMAGLDLNTSIIYLCMNVVLFAFAWKFFGWRFLLLSGAGLGTYLVGMEFGTIPAIASNTEDPMLYCFIGAIFIGLAAGVALRTGGSTGGSDVLGSLLNRAFPKVKTGYAILSVNVVVLTLNLITNGLQTGFYSLLIAIVGSLVTNMVLDNSKKIIAFHIICDKPDEISQAILSQYKRGVTRLDGQGMFTGNEKAILLCLVPYDQSYKMRDFVTKIDKNAFVYSTPVTETIGETKIFSKPLLNKEEAIKAAEIENSPIIIAEEKVDDTLQEQGTPIAVQEKSTEKKPAKKKTSTSTTKKSSTKVVAEKKNSDKKSQPKKTTAKNKKSKSTKKAD